MNWGFNLLPRSRPASLAALFLLCFAPQVQGGDFHFSARTWETAYLDGLSCKAQRTPANPAKTDRWTSPDKFDHLLVSAMMGGSAFLSLTVTRNDADRSFVSSVGAVIVIGALKEAYDAFSPGHQSSWKDFTADALGALLGALITRSL